MEFIDRRERYCVIGAGPSGLTVVKNLRQRGVACDCLERESELGGNWLYGAASSSVYASTHLISSKRLTEYTDFPMPDDYPPYPSHRQALDYLRSYAAHFGLAEHIEFDTSVERMEPASAALDRSDAGGWFVTLSDGGPPRWYGGVVIANGHHWDPLMPDLPGAFSGEMMHSREYKTPDVLRGRRVLVIGAGNSGCDIAVEAAVHAEAAFHSMRRGYHFLPKFLLGKPIDVCGERLLRWRMPLWLRRGIAGLLVRIAQGPPQRYGLPRPDHKLFESHPIVNSQLLYYVGHGTITVKGDVRRLCGDRVEFADGSVEPIDLIICATGYKISFPFLAESYWDTHDGRPDLYLNAFHRRRDDLFVAGLIQPNSGQWGLTDLQAQLMAGYIVARRRGAPAAEWFRRLKAGGRGDESHGIRFLNSPRHALEVEYFSYRQKLQKLLKKFGAEGRAQYADWPHPIAAASVRSFDGTERPARSSPHPVDSRMQ